MTKLIPLVVQMAILIPLLFLFGCGQKNDTSESSKALDERHVLVTVNDEVINEDDLNSAITRTLGDYAAFQLGETGRSKVLQSLVLSKAMAITQKSAMPAEDLDEIERMVTAYREELLAKRYLQENVVALPVTQVMVLDYYHQNPEKFGGKIIKTFEVIKGLVKDKGKARNDIIAQIEQFDQESNWQVIAERMKSNGMSVDYSKGAVTAGVLTTDIDNIIQNLSIHQASSLHFIQGLPIRVRVIDEKIIQPKPLAAVSGLIKKSLAPLQLKKAIKKQTENLLQQVTVTYPKTKQ